MKIVTWNINGIRTFKNGIKNILDSFDADIICVQETKVTRKCFKETRDFEWVDKAHAPFFYHLITLTAQHIFFSGDLLDEKTAIVDGYNSYFSFSRARSGYSGKASYRTIKRQ